MPIELKEVYVNLKNHEFDLLGDYKIDENEAKKFMDAIEDMMEREKERCQKRS